MTAPAAAAAVGGTGTTQDAPVDEVGHHLQPATLFNISPRSLTCDFPLQGNEWLDYKEEQEKDYSGLKLRQLAEPEPEPEPEVDETPTEDQTPVEPVWKAVTSSSESAPVAAAAAVTAVKDEAANKSVYISPALRNAALMGPSKLTKSKAAPDLDSDTFFPALGTEPPKPVVLGKLTPSSSGGGGQGYRPPQARASAWGQSQGGGGGVSLGNRFRTLDTDDS